MKAAELLVDTNGRPQWQRLFHQPVLHAPPPSAVDQHAAMRRRELGLEAPALFKLLDDLLDVLAVANGRNEGRIRGRDNGNVLQPDGRKQAPFAAQI